MKELDEQLLKYTPGDPFPADLVDPLSKLAWVIAWSHYKGRHDLFDFDDLYQECWLGLIDAWSRFNPDAGVGFHHYASKRASGHLMDFMRSCSKLSTGKRRKDDVFEGLEREYRSEPYFQTIQDPQDVYRDLRNAMNNRALARAASDSLNERYQETLIDLYWRGLTMLQTGKHLKVNESRISQIHKSALEKLRNALPDPSAFDIL